MLQQLTIRNFQKHKKLTIEFDPHITCIVGKSDAGKSAVLRAIRFLCLNKAPSTYLRQGAAQAEVSLTIDKHAIKRSKGTENTYHLDGQEYKAFGTDVPDTISKLLNLDDLNFQLQHAGSFWLSLSSGQVSRELNSIVDLSEIDASLSVVAAELRQAKSTVSVTETRLTEARERKKALAYAPQLDEELKGIEQLYTEWQETAQKSTEITSVISRLGVYQIDHQNAADAATDAGNLLLEMERIGQKEDERNMLNKLIAELEKTEKLNRIDLSGWDNIRQDRKAWEQSKERLHALQHLIREIEQCQQKRNDIDRNLSIHSAELKKTERKQERCPRCGQSIPIPS